MSSLLPKLSALIEEESKLLKGVKDGINFLKDELSSMNTLLVKLANNEERLDEQVKDWRNKVRELSYDVEDCIDLFMHKLESDGYDKADLVKKTTSKIKKLWSRHKIGKLINKLKARVQEESDRRWRYKFDESAVNLGKVQIDPRLPALFVEAERLVGIDGPREKIVEWLKKDDSEPQLKVVSIVGFGGLDKTTLANQVHHKIKGQFDCSTFVPVSRNPNIAKILTDMLKELGSSVDTSDDERQLIYKLRAFLHDKRYLIIVDDIWSTKAWEFVKSALPENNSCSRIITTTRDTNVATSCCYTVAGHVHNIQPLSEQDSRELFLKRVFRDVSACPPYLEEVSCGIIRKCHGLPLAIISVASLLVGKPNIVEQWEEVYNSIGSAFTQQGMTDILLLSYYDLPHYLKTCLLYLSMFPEDYRIEREVLIWRWIAEGFISEVKGLTLDQVAENYFNDLVNRSMIQPIDIQYDGRASACRVHDMILDLIVSLSKEENFTTLMEREGYNCSNKIRRLSVQSNCLGNKAMQEIMGKCSQLRSLNYYGVQDVGTDLQTLHCLRVLVFENCHGIGTQHIKHLESFFRLAYLSISSDGITELPEQIGDLKYLQTLDIRRSGIKKLPPTIGRLQNLARLLVGNDVELPNEIGDLQALQELSDAGKYDSIKFVQQLRRLTRLSVPRIMLHESNKLGDHNTEMYKETLKSSLAMMGKHALQTLHIGCNGFLRGKLMDILCCTVPSLRKLVISQSRWRVLLISLIFRYGIKQEELLILGGIPSLLFIKLNSQHAPEERLIISSQQFRCLKEFEFGNYYHGGGLEMLCLQGAMPDLRRLRFYIRAEETGSKIGFEFGFEHLASLQQHSVTVDCRGATRKRVEAAEAAMRDAASIHPGRPALEISRRWERDMIKDKDDHEEIVQVE
uniref:NB-ARC domain-containing protein n=1 Tax=Oryza barthii TaxID=65489 RepID=A0A0D3HT60_9ORYZ